jgi:hypothetical protein
MHRKLVGFVIALGAMGSPASAALLTYTVGYASFGGIAIPQFDPAYGTLNSARLTVTGHLDYTFVDETPEPTVSTYAYSAFYSLYYFDRTLDFGVDGSGTTTFGTAPTISLPADGEGTRLIGADRLAFTIGTGTFNGSITTDPPYSITVPDGSIYPDTDGPRSINGTVRIDYDYIAPVVPEPASWAMMIGGFALAGGALRRRRQAWCFTPV